MRTLRGVLQSLSRRIYKFFFVLGNAGIGLRIMLKHRGVASIRTDITWDERVLLCKLAGRVPMHGKIVEIGSYLGASTAILALGSAKTGTAIHAVDTWHNEGMNEGLRDTFAEFRRNVDVFGERVIAHRGKSGDVVHAFSAGIDLLFIDGDHSYDGCHRDLEDWLPLMNSGGIVVLHDISWAEGVRQAVREEISRGGLIRAHYLPNVMWASVEKDSRRRGAE